MLGTTILFAKYIEIQKNCNILSFGVFQTKNEVTNYFFLFSAKVTFKNTFNRKHVSKIIHLTWPASMSIQFEKLFEIPTCQSAEKQKYSGLGNVQIAPFLFPADRNLGFQVALPQSFGARPVKLIYVVRVIQAQFLSDGVIGKCYFLGAFSTFFVFWENWTMKIGLIAVTGGHQPK